MACAPRAHPSPPEERPELRAGDASEADVLAAKGLWGAAAVERHLVCLPISTRVLGKNTMRDAARNKKSW